MTIVHIVAFKSQLPPSSEQEKKLISSFEALATECVKAETKKPYITSLKCGRQCSPEGMTKGIELIFVLEFENFEDRDYYLDHDPAHIDFKNRVPTEFKVGDAAVMDFEVELKKCLGRYHRGFSIWDHRFVNVTGTPVIVVTVLPSATATVISSTTLL